MPRKSETVFDVQESLKELKKTRDEVRKGKYNPAQMRALCSLFSNENKMYAETVKVNRMAGSKLDKEKPRLKNVTI